MYSMLVEEPRQSELFHQKGLTILVESRVQDEYKLARLEPMYSEIKK